MYHGAVHVFEQSPCCWIFCSTNLYIESPKLMSWSRPVRVSYTRSLCGRLLLAVANSLLCSTDFIHRFGFDRRLDKYPIYLRYLSHLTLVGHVFVLFRYQPTQSCLYLHLFARWDSGNFQRYEGDPSSKEDVEVRHFPLLSNLGTPKLSLKSLNSNS